MRKSVDIKAVWDADLEILLKNLGMWEEFQLGRLACAACGSAVDLDNLGAIVPKPDGATVICDAIACVRACTAPEVPQASA